MDMDIKVCSLHTQEDDPNLFFSSCRGRDVSGGGVSFFGECRYPQQGLLRLQIPLRPPGFPEGGVDLGPSCLKVMGTVRWCKKNSAEDRYVTGVQFLPIYEEDFQLLTDYLLKALIG